MRAVGEGQVPPGVRTADVEPVWITESHRVPIRSRDGHRDLIASPDIGTAEPGIPGRVAVDHGRGRFQPQ